MKMNCLLMHMRTSLLLLGICLTQSSTLILMLKTLVILNLHPTRPHKFSFLLTPILLLPRLASPFLFLRLLLLLSRDGLQSRRGVMS
ncbi:hypothetical protein EDC96DRAFT_565436 [Choanephora cucurbitarum]|nr:hypothetical protein EDC96DRAFT_565436 [Choanephora cucurbitarum]